ncbi:MAG: acyltransferase family protein [Bacillota bacterium]|nr:acyltransferase family protein [Bacillota bacterium]
MTEPKKERNYLFDNLKALLIFCVVFAHFLRVSGHFEVESLSRTIYIICFTFMMQGFFFTSGFFSQNVDKCRAKAVETLALPYFVFMILNYFARLIIFGEAHLNFLQPSHAMWFLIAMFIYRFGIKTFDKIPFVLPLSAILYFAAGAIPFLGATLALGRSCSFLVFFMLGYFCRWEHINKLRRIPKPVMIIPAAALLYLSNQYACQKDYSVDLLLLKSNYIDQGASLTEDMMARLIVLIASLLWLAIWINWMPNKRLPVISVIGQNTMTVFLLHIFVRYVMKWRGLRELTMIDEGDIVYCLIIMGIAMICVYLFSRPIVAKAYDRSMHFLYQIGAAPLTRMVK